MERREREEKHYLGLFHSFVFIYQVSRSTRRNVWHEQALLLGVM